MKKTSNRIRRTRGELAFDIFNHILLALIALLTLFPFWDTFVVSISTLKGYLSSSFHFYADPVSLEAYQKIMEIDGFWLSYLNSIFITVAGTLLSLILTTMGAYVLSRPQLKGRRFIMMLIVFTMLFQGGLIPSYIVVRNLSLMNTLWAMILPVAISTYNLIVMRNFFESLPISLEESAMIDGCTEVGVLFRIVLPTSLPIITTISLFYAVAYWNDYMQAILYVTKYNKWPLQLFLRSMLFETDATYMSGGNDLYLLGQPVKMAAVMIAVIPIMCTYPFFQKHFVKGVLLGAVKE